MCTEIRFRLSQLAQFLLHVHDQPVLQIVPLEVERISQQLFCLPRIL